MKRVYLDIETIPGQDPALWDEIAEGVTPPANMSKPETIAKWEEEQKPAKVEEEWRKTALSGDRGEIVAIGWAVDNQEATVFWRGLDDGDPNSEATLLDAFLSELDSEFNRTGQPISPQWVGHNVKDFDLRFIWQRAVINGVRPTVPLPHDARPGSKEIFDTMTAWAGFGNRISLDRLCKALGIEQKGELDGSMVWDYVRDGREDEVAEYCRADVERVRQAHHRMTFNQFSEE